MLFFMLRNMFITDYKDETKSYLKSIGRSDSIDNIIPKTADEIREEQLQRDEAIDILLKNVTTLITDFQSLRREVDQIKAQVNNATLD